MTTKETYEAARRRFLALEGVQDKGISFVINELLPQPQTDKDTFQILKAKKDGAIRRETLEGREHIVVPMVMLTTGVHTGSGGSLFYPEDELSKVPAVWNAKPIVVYHPQKNGQGVSACDPTVLNTSKVGVILNTVWDSGKLRAEAWLEDARIDNVDPRIREFIDGGKIMELSTGLFTDNEPANGEWNGQTYTAIARNYRPDHLALLPDQIGACSVAKGAGLLQMNELSYGKISNALYDLMRPTLRPASGMHSDGYIPSVGWIEDVYDTFFIYSLHDKLYKRTYSVDANDNVSLGDDDPVEVRRVTEYRTVEGNTFVGNASGRFISKGNDAMNKDQMIANLIAGGVWVESDRATLNAMSVDQLQKLMGLVKAPAQTQNTNPQQPQQQQAPASVVVAPIAPQPQQNSQPQQPATAAQYIATMPREIQEVYNFGMQTINQERNRLIDVVVGNQQNRFTKEQLATYDTPTLQALAALAAPPAAPAYAPQPNFNAFGNMGQSAAPMYFGASPVANGQPQQNQIKVQPLPSLSTFDPPAVGNKKTEA